VDDADDPLARLDVLLDRSARYHRVVAALDLAMEGRAEEACVDLDRMLEEDPEAEPDLLMWRALVVGLAGREDAARDAVAELQATAPAFVETLRRFGPAGLVPDPTLLDRILPDGS
jgi:hypothetical protein